MDGRVGGWMWKDGCERMDVKGWMWKDESRGFFGWWFEWQLLRMFKNFIKNNQKWQWRHRLKNSSFEKNIFHYFFLRDESLMRECEVLIVNCTWWDHNMHHIKACNDGKWHVNGEKLKTARVTCTIRNAKLQLDLLFLPTCTLAMHMLFVFWDYYDYMYLTHSRERSGGDSSLWPTRFKVWWWQQCWSLEHQTNKRLDKWL